MDIDKLVENYFAPKEENVLSKDMLWELFEEIITEQKTIKEGKTKTSSAKKFILSLPKMTPTEAWGDPANNARKEMETFFRAIGGGANVDEKIKYLERLQNETPKGGRRITSPRRIISTLILLESLSSCLNSFGASSAGFVFEGFLAGLLGGHQVADPEKGSLPIEDIIAFSSWEGSANMPMSLKVLKGGESARTGSAIKGSYTNLIDALTKTPAMKYIVAYKEGDKEVSAIDIVSFDLTTDNFLDIMERSGHNTKLLKLGKRSIRSSNKFLRSLSSWEEMLPYLQRSDGYGREPTVPLPGEEVEPNAPTPDGIELDKYGYAHLKEGRSHGTQWYVNMKQLEEISGAVDYKTLGTLKVSPGALLKTAEMYMDVLSDSITSLFEAVSELSTNVNSYFITENRNEAIDKGNTAIKYADTIAEQMSAQTTSDEEV